MTTYYKVYEASTGVEHALYTNAARAAAVAESLTALYAFYLGLRYLVAVMN